MLPPTDPKVIKDWKTGLVEKLKASIHLKEKPRDSSFLKSLIDGLSTGEQGDFGIFYKNSKDHPSGMVGFLSLLPSVIREASLWPKMAEIDSQISLLNEERKLREKYIRLLKANRISSLQHRRVVDKARSDELKALRKSAVRSSSKNVEPPHYNPSEGIPLQDFLLNALNLVNLSLPDAEVLRESKSSLGGTVTTKKEPSQVACDSLVYNAIVIFKERRTNLIHRILSQEIVVEEIGQPVSEATVERRAREIAKTLQ